MVTGGVGAYNQAAEAVSRAGSAHEAADKQSKTFAHTIEQLKATFEDIGVVLGNDLIPWITRAGEVLAGTVQFFERHRQVALALAAVIGGVLVTSIGMWVASMIAAGTVTAALGVAMDALPWVAVIAGLVLLAANWSTVWGAIRTAALDVWGALTTAWDATVGALVTAWTAVAAALESAWSAFTAAVTTAWTAITGAVTTVWNAIFGPSGVVMSAWNVIAGALQAAWHAYVTVVTTEWSLITGAVTFAWNLIFGPSGAVMTVWHAIAGAVMAEWNGWVRIVSTVWGSITGAVTAVWGAVFGPTGAVMAAWTTVKSTLEGAWTAWSATVSGIWNGIVGGITGAWGGLSGAASKVWSDVKGAFVSGIDDVIRGMNRVFVDPLRSVLGTFGVHIGDIPVITAAQGTRIGAGFKTGGPTVVTGEGRPEFPEYVIPTDPQYRANATRLIVSALADMGHPKLASGGVLGWAEGAASSVGGAISDATGAISSAVGDVTGALVGPAIDAVKSALDSTVGGVPPPFIGNMAKQFVGTMLDDLKGFLTGRHAHGGGSGLTGVPGNVPVGNHLALIDQALTLAAQTVSAANEAAVNLIVTHESGWNPNAINDWDINAQHGDPSRGLMQTIGSTFEAYRLPSLPDNIYDPLANLVAGIRYAIGRYGSLLSVPGVASVARGGAYMGYEAGGILGLPVGVFDTGGFLPQGWSIAGNFTGGPELVPRPSSSSGGHIFSLTFAPVVSGVDPDKVVGQMREMVDEALDDFVVATEHLSASAGRG